MSVTTYAIRLQRKILKTLKSDSGGIEPIYIYTLGLYPSLKKQNQIPEESNPYILGIIPILKKLKSDSVGIEPIHQLLVHTPILYIAHIIHTIYFAIFCDFLRFFATLCDFLRFFAIFCDFLQFFAIFAIFAIFPAMYLVFILWLLSFWLVIRNTRRYLGVRCEYTPLTVGVFTLDFKIDV